MCFINEHNLIALLRKYNKNIFAVRSSDGQMVWDKSTLLRDKIVCDPLGIVYVQSADLVIVGDGYKHSRIILLDGSTGDIVRTIHLEKECTSVRELHV